MNTFLIISSPALDFTSDGENWFSSSRVTMGAGLKGPYIRYVTVHTCARYGLSRINIFRGSGKQHSGEVFRCAEWETTFPIHIISELRWLTFQRLYHICFNLVYRGTPDSGLSPISASTWCTEESQTLGLHSASTWCNEKGQALVKYALSMTTHPLWTPLSATRNHNIHHLLEFRLQTPTRKT